MKYDIFISYRREGGFETAKLLADRLKADGYRVFLDIEALRTGKFNNQLYQVIESCEDFILILSEDSLDRCINSEDWLRLEILQALKNKKNIVPIILRNFSFPIQMPKGMEELALHHGVTSSQEFFDASYKKIKGFLKSKPNKKRMLYYSIILITIFVIGFWVILLISPNPPNKTNDLPINVTETPEIHQITENEVSSDMHDKEMGGIFQDSPSSQKKEDSPIIAKDVEKTISPLKPINKNIANNIKIKVLRYSDILRVHPITYASQYSDSLKLLVDFLDDNPEYLENDKYTASLLNRLFSGVDLFLFRDKNVKITTYLNTVFPVIQKSYKLDNEVWKSELDQSVLKYFESICDGNKKFYQSSPDDLREYIKNVLLLIMFKCEESDAINELNKIIPNNDNLALNIFYDHVHNEINYSYRIIVEAIKKIVNERDGTMSIPEEIKVNDDIYIIRYTIKFSDDNVQQIEWKVNISTKEVIINNDSTSGYIDYIIQNIRN